MHEPPDDIAARALEERVAAARAGDAGALEEVVGAVQKDVYALALRFLWHPQDAEDATQEILVRIVTRLGTFEGRSSFRTWVYRVASNALLDMTPKPAETQTVSFEEFGRDLERGQSQTLTAAPPGVEEALLLEEVKIGCTHALLLCLDRAHRLAFILGEILELGHREAAEVLGTAPATFRKRLSRARRRLTVFLDGHCGLFNRDNGCRCRRRVDPAVKLGRVDPKRLLFAANAARAKRFPRVLQEIRRLEATRRTAALYRSHPDPEMRKDLAPKLRRLLAVTASPAEG